MPQEQDNDVQAKSHWNRTMNGSDTTNANARWQTSGYRDVRIPPLWDKHRVNNGSLRANYNGSGNADRIILSYSYTFNGYVGTYSFAPGLTRSSKTVSWRSAPVSNRSYLSTTSLWAEGSALVLNNLELRSTPEIYKGSRIYRPDLYSSRP